MTQIKLTIPARNDLPDPRIETRPTELRRFLEQLPYTDPVKTCLIVSDELAALNRQRLPPQVRLPLVELYRQTFRKLIQLQSRLLRGGTAVRQSRRAGESLSALSRLARELSFAFKIVVTDRMAESGGKTADRILQASILRAIKFLGFEQLFSYHSYAPASSHVWGELNQLYALALTHGMADSAYIDDENSALPSSSISHVFKQIALTARSDPYHLGNGEAWKVYDFLDRWAELGKITRAGDLQRKNGLFLIDLEGTAPPQPLNGERMEIDPDRHRLLDTHDLARWIDDQLRELEVGNNAVVESIHLDLPPQEIVRVLRYLMLTWWHCPTRQHERRERLSWVEGVCGLNSAHEMLKEDAELAAEPQSQKDDSIEISTSGAIRRPSGIRVQQERWRLINHSTGGVALGVRLPCNPAMRVGQLIVFRNPTGQDGNWLLGVIRWLSQEQEDEIKVGVQYLSDHAKPVIIRDTSGDSTRTIPALEIEIRQANRPMPPQLITPHGIYQPQKEAVIKAEGGQIRIRASKLIEATSSLDRFYFERLSTG